MFPPGNSVTTVKNFTFRREDKLGKGATGSVFLGTDTLTGQRVAIKVIDMKSISNEVTRYLLNNQKQALRSLSHPNIVQCLGIIEEAGHCYIVVEECPEGTLADYLKKRGGKLKEEEATSILRSIVSGCKHLHDKGVVHRDLKPSNILMKGGQPKISDFGFCEIAGVKKPNMYYNVGSPSYMPPEAYIKNYYSEKSDVWAIGMIFYEMMKGQTLDRGMEVSEMYNFIRTGGRFVPPGTTSHGERILQECLKFDFNHRIGFNDLERLMATKQTIQHGRQSEGVIDHTDVKSLKGTNSKPPLGSVRSLVENPKVSKVFQNQPVSDAPHPLHQILNVSNRRQVKGNRENPFDRLNITDPSINQSMLSDNTRTNIKPSKSIQKHQNTGRILNERGPQVVEQHYFPSRITKPPPSQKVSHVGGPVLNQRPLPLQTIVNTPRHLQKHPDSLTIYRNF